MSWRECAVSLLIVAFFAVKFYEGAMEVESWPLTYLPMFRERKPAALTPRRFAFETRPDGDGEARPVPAALLGLTDDQLVLRIAHSRQLVATCAELGVAYDRRRPPAVRAGRFRVTVRAIPRPGIPPGYLDRTVNCAIPSVLLRP